MGQGVSDQFKYDLYRNPTQFDLFERPIYKVFANKPISLLGMQEGKYILSYFHVHVYIARNQITKWIQKTVTFVMYIRYHLIFNWLNKQIKNTTRFVWDISSKLFLNKLIIRKSTY